MRFRVGKSGDLDPDGLLVQQESAAGDKTRVLSSVLWLWHVLEWFYEVGAHGEMATERTDEVRGLTSQQEGDMWFGEKTRIRQGRRLSR